MVIYFDIGAAVVKFMYLLYPGMTESGCVSVYFWSGKYTRNIISGQKLLLKCQKQCSTKNRQYLVNSEVNLQRLRTLKCILCVCVCVKQNHEAKTSFPSFLFLCKHNFNNNVSSKIFQIYYFFRGQTGFHTPWDRSYKLQTDRFIPCMLSLTLISRSIMFAGYTGEAAEENIPQPQGQ